MYRTDITEDTPIAMLTVGQLKEVLGLNSEREPEPKTPPKKEYVYGLRGIAALFNVSHVTAQRYKDTFLQPAVMQQGRRIIVDKERAMELFSQHTS